MKLKLMLSALMLLASGAASADFVVEGRIEFQDGDKWVKASALCVSGETFIHAAAKPKKSCNTTGDHGDDDRNCTYFPADFDQPFASTRARCDRREGERQGGACLEWVTVDFIQTAVVKNVHYTNYREYDDGGSPSKVTYTTIPPCADGSVDAN